MSKSLEIGSVINSGSAKIKKKIRDITRLLRRPNLPADVRVDNERALGALTAELESKQFDKKAQHLSKRYHMVRFFERKKAIRRLKNALNQLKELESASEPVKKDIKKQKKILKHCQVDVAYICNFPKSEKYISLYPTEAPATEGEKKGKKKTDAKRSELRKKFEKAFDDNTLAIKVEDVLAGKQIDHTKLVNHEVKAKPTVDEPKAEDDEFFD